MKILNFVFSFQLEMAAQSPLDPVDQILNVLGFFGGFPLIQDNEPHDLPAFNWRPSICRTIWNFLLNIFYFALPISFFFAIGYLNDYPAINIFFPYVEGNRFVIQNLPHTEVGPVLCYIMGIFQLNTIWNLLLHIFYFALPIIFFLQSTFSFL